MPGHYHHPKTQNQTMTKMNNLLLSDKNRVLAHARNVLVQREIRRNIMRSLRQAEREHVHGISSRIGETDQNLERLRRELLLAGMR